MEKEEKLYADLHLLGTGTSNGVPSLRCDCKNCEYIKKHKEWSKLRTCAVIYVSNGKTILIDCGTDMRKLVLKAGIKQVNGIVITHEHSDHVDGLHDLRKFAVKQGAPIPVYSTENVLPGLMNKFENDFQSDSSDDKSGEIKEKKRKYFEFIPIEHNDEFDLCGVRFRSIKLMHGDLPICGYRFGDCTYITDCSRIPKDSYPFIEGTKTLVINTLNKHYHRTHFCFKETINEIAKIKPERAYIVHVSHRTSHPRIQKFFDEAKLEKEDISSIPITVGRDHMVVGRVNL